MVKKIEIETPQEYGEGIIEIVIQPSKHCMATIATAVYIVSSYSEHHRVPSYHFDWLFWFI